MSALKAPFPWFGGKRRVAELVWRELGDVDNYVEPFAGSLAVLLGRPDIHARKAETVNDADNFLCNAWRALAADPDEVARHCDWPVNECDLLSRHIWLVNNGKERIERLEADPEFFDTKVAGWWLWGINAWIGSGWCAGNGPWGLVDGTVQKNGKSGGQWRQLPHLGTAGQGVNRQLPHLGSAGHSLSEYFRQLSDRLRRVRVCCGDWSRVVTRGALTYGASVGVFLDPPYLGDVRTNDLYRVDDHSISHDVREWCLRNGDDKRLRIVLAGYKDEHDQLLPDSWRRHAYSASKAYGTKAAAGSGKGNDANRHKEMLWMSPGCLGGSEEKDLFS